jgi:hypothetical protein
MTKISHSEIEYDFALHYRRDQIPFQCGEPIPNPVTDDQGDTHAFVGDATVVETETSYRIGPSPPRHTVYVKLYRSQFQHGLWQA